MGTILDPMEAVVTELFREAGVTPIPGTGAYDVKITATLSSDGVTLASQNVELTRGGVPSAPEGVAVSKT